MRFSLLLMLMLMLMLTVGLPVLGRQTLLRDGKLKKDKPVEFALDTACLERTIEVSAAISGNRNVHGLGSAQWGIELVGADCRPRLRATLRWGNTDLGGAFDRRFLRLTVDSMAPDGKSIELLKHDVFSDIDGYGGQNELVGEFAGGKAHFYVGNDYETYCGSVDFSSPCASFKIAANRNATIRRVGLHEQPDPTASLQTPWTAEAVEALTVRAASPVGLWEYLDRENDSRWAVPGGLYTLGIVPSAASADAFDIIYLSGARANAPKWHAGMLKGRLRPTRFAGHYSLEWYDADFSLMDEELTADLTLSPSILALNFPLWHSTLRFSRP